MSSIFKNNKDSKENRILDAFFFAKTKLHFTYLLPDFSNIDEVYTNNLNIWFLNNSENKETKDGKGIEILNGILLNPENIIFSKTKEGFELTEIDFINSELKSFEFLEFDKLNLIEQKQFKIYNEFLNKKKLHINWDLSDFLNHYKETKRFGFTFLKTYKKEAFEDLKDQLNKYFLRFCYILKNLPIEDRTELISDYKDQLLELKKKQTITKISLKIDEYLDLIDKEVIKNTPQQNEIIKNIELYKNCVNPLFLESYNHKINKDQTANNLYYFNRLTDNYRSLKNEIETNEAYKNYKNEALEFLVKEKSLILKTIKFLISCIENKNTTNIQLQWYEIEDQIKSIKNTINVIERFKINNDYVKALELKDFIKYRLNTVISYFESFTIYLNKTPIETLINDLISDFNNCIDVSEISQINALKTIPQQVESIKPDEVIKEFKDFFIPDVKIETINNIQTNYKDLIGKKMAFLIYLLETEFKIINYSLNGKNDSRKHFVKSLKSIDTKMQGINKHFEANSTNLSIHKFENDNDYKKIKDFLTKTI